MLVLAIDTATDNLVVGLVSTEDQQAYTHTSPAARGHNEELMPAVMALVEKAGVSLTEVEAIVVGTGPGPFTGLRVGMATASALGQALRIPVHGVCTLDALARQAGPGVCFVASDARRREIYWALYRNQQRIRGPEVGAPEACDIQAETAVMPEALFQRLPEGAISGEHADVALRAVDVVACADLTSPPAPLEPAYLRRPDAVEPAAAVRSPAIPEVQV